MEQEILKQVATLVEKSDVKRLRVYKRGDFYGYLYSKIIDQGLNSFNSLGNLYIVTSNRNDMLPDEIIVETVKAFT